LDDFKKTQYEILCSLLFFLIQEKMKKKFTFIFYNYQKIIKNVIMLRFIG